MYKKRPNPSAFTIVELLIVVVIIGVLATVVIVAYSTTVRNANNSQTVSAVVAHVKSLRQYATDNGGWPASVSWRCVGDGYVAKDGFGATECGQVAGTCVSAAVSCTSSTNSAYNTAIRKYFNDSSIPTPSQQVVNYNGTNYRGAWAYASSSTSSLEVRYWLSGDVPCNSPTGLKATKFYGDSNSAVCQISLASP